MRTALCLVLAVLAGLLAALALAGARLDALVHTPEPLQEIAGPMSGDPELRAGLADRMGAMVEENLPQELPSFLPAGLPELARGAADGMVADDRFAGAWSAALEQTRADWLERLDRVGTGGDDGTVHLQLEPLAGLGLDRLAESLEPLPGGDSAAQAVRAGAGSAIAELENGTGDGGGGGDAGSSPLAFDLAVPDPDRLDPQWTARVVALLPHWPWLAGLAVVEALLALLVAPRGRRWLVMVTAGATVLLAGVAGRWALERASVGSVDGLARIAAEPLVQGVRAYALPDTALLMAGGALAIGLGVVIGLVSRPRARARR